MSDEAPAQLLQQLSQARTAAEAHAAFRGALASYDQLNEQTIRQTAARLDCCAGCSICCSLRIEVYAHEVFLIADHILATFSDAELLALKERLAAHSEKVLPLTPMEHAVQNNVCPLLRDGLCSVYAVRPQTCRRHHSLDVAACQFAYDHPADLDFPSPHHPELFRVLSEAMRQNTEAYAQLGFDTTIYELGTALEEALADPESWSGWCERMNAFLRASVTPSS
ncbi:MAG TPA: YkgJ family cysteine cluster protein [Chthoniobacteraceae bacterium]|jgi:Fe-S-cluster containining protein|nr:YkgJ family cysteine cluster protein [Chthoniobacteraceae bacterium]